MLNPKVRKINLKVGGKGPGRTFFLFLNIGTYLLVLLHIFQLYNGFLEFLIITNTQISTKYEVSLDILIITIEMATLYWLY